jgi:hypothetical protein
MPFKVSPSGVTVTASNSALEMPPICWLANPFSVMLSIADSAIPPAISWMIAPLISCCR